MKLEAREEAYSCIYGDLRDGLQKNRLEDRARATPPPKPKVEVTVLDLPPKRSEQELIRRQLIVDWERVLEQRRRLWK